MAAESPLKQQHSFLRAAIGRRSFLVLCILYLLALGADFLAPYRVDSSREADKYHPPNVQFVDARGRAHAWPFVQRSRATFDAYQRRSYELQSGQRFALRFFVRGERYRFLGLFECDVHLFGVHGTGADPHPEPAPRVYVFGCHE